MHFFILFLIIFCHLCPSFCNAKTALQALEEQDRVRIGQWADRDTSSIQTASKVGTDIIIGNHKNHTISTSRGATARERDQMFSFLIRSVLMVPSSAQPNYKDFFGDLNAQKPIDKGTRAHQLIAYMVYRAAQLYEGSKGDLDTISARMVFSDDELARLSSENKDVPFKQALASFLSFLNNDATLLLTVLNSGTKSFIELYSQAQDRLRKDGLLKEAKNASVIEPLITWQMTRKDVNAIDAAVQTLSLEELKTLIPLVNKNFMPLGIQSGELIATLLTELKKIPAQDRTAVAERAKAWGFITEKTLSGMVTYIIRNLHACKDFPIDVMAVRVRYVKQEGLLYQGSGLLNDDLIVVLKDIPIEQLHILVPLLKEFPNYKKLSFHTGASVLKALSKVKEDKVTHLVALIKKEFELKDKFNYGLEDILEGVKEFSAGEAARLIELAKKEAIIKKDRSDGGLDKPLTKNSEGSAIKERLKLLSLFKSLSVDKSADIVRLVREEVVVSELEFSSDLKGVYSLLLEIPIADAKAILETYKGNPLTKSITIEDYLNILREFKGVPAKDVSLLWNTAQEFIPRDGSVWNQWNVVRRTLRTFKRIPAVELPSFINFVRETFQGLTFAQLLEIVQVIVETEVTERKPIISAFKTIKPSIREAMNASQIQNALMILKRLPDQEERLNAVAQVNGRTDTSTPDAYLGALERFIRELPVQFKPGSYYTEYDARPVHINRKTLQQAKKPKLPELKEKEGKIIIEDFDKIISSFTLTDKSKPNYLSYETITSQSQASDAENKQNVEKVIPRARGFLKVLFGLPLEGKEEGGWQTQGEQKPSLRKAIQAILEKLLRTEDLTTRALNMSTFMNGLLYCPTGQKEGIETVVGALFSDSTQATTSVVERVKQIVARFKEDQINHILTVSQYGQNVHLRSYYKEILGPDLGIESALEGFRERLHNPQHDTFGGRPIIVLKRFFERVTPDTLAKELFKHVKNEADLKIEDGINDISEQIRKIQSRLAPPKLSASVDIEKMERDLKALQEELEKRGDAPKDKEDNEDLTRQIKQKEMRIQKEKTNIQKAVQKPLSSEKAAEKPLGSEEKAALEKELKILRENLNKLKETQHSNVIYLRPIRTQSLVEYVLNSHEKELKALEEAPKLPGDRSEVEEERRKILGQYFTLDKEGYPRLLHEKGASQLLVNLGYIVVAATS